MQSNQTSKLRKVTVTAMLAAVASVLMFVEFPIPLMPSFIKLDVSDFPALISSFAFGPISGIVVELIKNLLHILIKGTSSAGVGELSNFLLGCCFVIPAGLIYKKSRNYKSAIVGALVGCLVMAVLCLPINYFIVYPAYVKFYGMPLEAIIGMYKDILPSADSLFGNGLFSCLLIFNAPFTFAKGLIDAVICIIIYKPLSHVMFGKGE